MADAQSSDNAAKARIIKHLNGDHSDSLSLYLRHFGGLSSSAASSPTMTDISFTNMTFHTRDGKIHNLPIDPPMKAWSDARLRTEQMDRESRAALGVCSVKITEYELPYGMLQWSIIGLIVFALIAYTNLQSIVPGTFIYDTLLPWFPGGRGFFFRFVEILPYLVLGIHLGEAIWLDRSRLRKYNVERGSLLWWKWFVSAVAEGGGTFLRIDATVKRKQAEKEKKKH